MRWGEADAVGPRAFPAESARVLGSGSCEGLAAPSAPSSCPGVRARRFARVYRVSLLCLFVLTFPIVVLIHFFLGTFRPERVTLRFLGYTNGRR